MGTMTSLTVPPYFGEQKRSVLRLAKKNESMTKPRKEGRVELLRSIIGK